MLKSKNKNIQWERTNEKELNFEKDRWDVKISSIALVKSKRFQEGIFDIIAHIRENHLRALSFLIEIRHVEFHIDKQKIE